MRRFTSSYDLLMQRCNPGHVRRRLHRQNRFSVVPLTVESNHTYISRSFLTLFQLRHPLCLFAMDSMLTLDESAHVVTVLRVFWCICEYACSGTDVSMVTSNRSIFNSAAELLDKLLDGVDYERQCEINATWGKQLHMLL